MSKVELLAPAGDFESLISAVQNGANAVYLGANKFNARANGKNFNNEELVKAIEYAKLRNVKTHLTLNILIKNDEFEDAMKLVKFAYNSGIDAVIVQDIGLAKRIIDSFPDLEVHGSTQMTIYNSSGVSELEKLGFKRAVLARELSIKEIKKICDDSKIDIEVFIHGALCISYSGQCLMSSIIGGRSGNRGKCAGTCRLPYELIDRKNNQILDKGYLLSSKDVCTLDILPELINTGVKSFKIEGRMKSPEYVGIVTSIYRKYIDLAESEEEYIVDENDRKKLMQIFNRGGFSTGYLKGKLGKEMMYKYKPNHIGIYIGKVISYKEPKGYVKFKVEDEIELGDSISINDSSCKISELMENKNNIKNAKIGKVVTIGRINGKIKPGDKIFKTVSDRLIKDINRVNCKENIKRKVDCKVILNNEKKMEIELTDKLTNTKIKVIGENISNFINGQSMDSMIQKKEIIPRIEEQIRKTGNTIFEMQKVEIQKDNNLFIPIKNINELRRNGIELLEDKLRYNIKRNFIEPVKEKLDNGINENSIKNFEDAKNVQTSKKDKDKIEISLLINEIKNNYDYLKLDKDIDNIYIPISNFFSNEQKNKIEQMSKKFNVYIYLPVILKEKYKELFEQKVDELYKIGIRGFVLSNISQLEIVSKFKCEKIANYTFNIFNDESVKRIRRYGFCKYTVSPELNQKNIKEIESEQIKKELIVYGRTVLMNSEYCPIGIFNNCNKMCEGKEVALKDRKGFIFPIKTDRINCNSKIYNSKITSIKWGDCDVDSIRIDILDEDIEEINKIIKIYRKNEKIEGKEYTNGNFNTDI